MSGENNGSPKSKRGFASMDKGEQKVIASRGGRAAHSKGTAHEFDRAEAGAAGRKGAASMKVKLGEEYSAYMVQIGRNGGLARADKMKLKV
ncbi:stress-induced protein [Candidatus Parcubacteria bacterium]|nr:stress-induced protein [Candidatus Parcubacteria bacterium]